MDVCAEENILVQLKAFSKKKKKKKISDGYELLKAYGSLLECYNLNRDV